MQPHGKACKVNVCSEARTTSGEREEVKLFSRGEVMVFTHAWLLQTQFT